MPSPATKRAAALLRVSTDLPELDSQRLAVEGWAERAGATITWYEEELRNRPEPVPVPPRTAIDMIADGAAAAIKRGDTEAQYLAAVTSDSASAEIDETLRRYRDQLIAAGRWPWVVSSPANNGNPRLRAGPAEDETTKKVARFDKLVADLSPARKIALLERLEGAVKLGGRIRRTKEQDLEGDEELRELLLNDLGGALRTLLPAFFAAIADDVLCPAHDRRYRKSCPFCGASMTDVSISRGACGNCWQRTWVKEALDQMKGA